jgi:hypothetical protein
MAPLRAELCLHSVSVARNSPLQARSASLIPSILSIHVQIFPYSRPFASIRGSESSATQNPLLKTPLDISVQIGQMLDVKIPSGLRTVDALVG